MAAWQHATSCQSKPTPGSRVCNKPSTHSSPRWGSTPPALRAASAPAVSLPEGGQKEGAHMAGQEERLALHIVLREALVIQNVANGLQARRAQRARVGEG